MIIVEYEKGGVSQFFRQLKFPAIHIPAKNIVPIQILAKQNPAMLIPTNLFLCHANLAVFNFKSFRLKNK